MQETERQFEEEGEMTRVREISTPLRFVVTVDTEADDAWTQPESVKVTNIRQLERFQDLCDKYDVVPTYLLAYECATRDEALKILKPLSENRRCEIGHHLHVWTTPPFQREGPTGVDLDWIHAFQFQLPDSLFAEKAECLRQAIEKNFGRSPTSHRAGRWGIDQRTVNWLAKSGFVVETSMRKGIRLRNLGAEVREPISAGRRIEATEYGLHNNPYIWPSSSHNGSADSVVEIPATVDVPDDFVMNVLLRYLALKWPGEPFLFRVYRKLAGMGILYPDPAKPPGEMPRIIDRAIKRGATVINLMLHSSELALHCSPFSNTQEDLDGVWHHLEEAFRYTRDREMTSDGISNVAQLARRNVMRN
jgi:hypothetical protein